MAQILGNPDEGTEQVAATLGRYEASHQDAECFVRRYNPASIRVKIVDATFHGMSKADRHDYARSYLSELPDDVLSQVSMLLCLEPGERGDLLELEFHDPSRSYL